MLGRSDRRSRSIAAAARQNTTEKAPLDRGEDDFFAAASSLISSQIAIANT